METVDRLVTFVGGTRARILQLLRRTASTVGEMADAVGITGNAVRGHVTALQRDGLVREAGTAPSTGGKPAQRYDLTPEGEEIFPKAYAFVLEELIRQLRSRDGEEATIGLLQAVGRAAADSADAKGEGTGARVAAAADVLRSMGGDVEVTRVDEGWEIRGFGCPLSTVVVHEPDTCCLAQAMVSSVTGRCVREHCDRSGERARCAFTVLES